MSNFALQGFDQRVPPQFEHSTSAWIAQIGPGEDDTWLYAIDSIDNAGFTPLGGVFFVTVSLAEMFAHVPSQFQQGLIEYIWEAFICSYVLVYEPPLPNPSGGAGQSFPIKCQLISPVSGIPAGIGSSLLPRSVAQQFLPARGSVFDAHVKATSNISPATQIRCRCQCDCCRKGKCKPHKCTCMCICCQKSATKPCC